jgi:hypothetical protein
MMALLARSGLVFSEPEARSVIRPRTCWRMDAGTSISSLGCEISHGKHPVELGSEGTMNLNLRIVFEIFNQNLSSFI